MRRKNLPEQHPSLKTVQKEFRKWRKNRRSRGIIPQELWEAAVKLTRNHSVNDVAKTLQLNYTALRERTTKNTPIKESVPDFVELNLNDRVSPGVESGCEIEVEDVLGWKLRFRGNRIMELLPAVTRFWEKRT